MYFLWSRKNDNGRSYNANNNKYNWKPDGHDERDFVWNTGSLRTDEDHVDLSGQFPVVYDQGELGSCTANAICGLFEYIEIQEESPLVTTSFIEDEEDFYIHHQPPNYTPSRLFLYYNERRMEGTISRDAGATLRDGIKCTVEFGICSEKVWPYDISKYQREPTEECYHMAFQHRVSQYIRVPQTEHDIENILSQKLPIVFGVQVYSSFESESVAQTGQIPLPEPSQETFLGGHAIVLVGYDRKRRQFKIRNSWGTLWGQEGYGYIPYAYALNRSLASDFWTFQKVALGESFPYEVKKTSEEKVVPKRQVWEEVRSLIHQLYERIH